MSIVRRMVMTGMVLATSIGTVVGCSHESGRGKVRSYRHIPLAAVDTALARQTQMRWDSAAGSVIALVIDSLPDSVYLVGPELIGGHLDTTMASPRSSIKAGFDLFGRSGAFGTTVLLINHSNLLQRSSDSTCVEWPTTAISLSRRGWHVGLEAGRANAIKLDSIEGMPPSDSAMFAVQIARIASMLPELRDSVFNNVPFVVRSAYRFRSASMEGIAASTRREIPSEATPREEQVFFIAERSIGSSDDYHVAFSTRSAGEEGSTSVTNVLATVVLSDGHRLAMIVSNEYEDASSVALIERLAPQQWRLVWHSSYTGCK